MIKGTFRGVIPATLTVFNRDGSLDIKGQKAFITWLVNQGIHGMMVCGTGGEFVAMSVNERKKVMEATVEANAGKVPILAQTGHYSTETSIELSKHAEKLGVEAVAIITPYYIPRSEDEYYHHYASIRDAIDIPIIMYHNPTFAGEAARLSPDLIAKMYKDKVIAGFKDSSGEISRNVNMRLLTDDNFILIHGLDIFPIESFLMGADAWVAGVANVLPGEFSNIYELTQKGDWMTARDEWIRMKPFVNFCISPKEGRATHQMEIYHSGARMRGIPAGYTRKPSIPLEDYGEKGKALLASLKDQLRQYGY